MVKIIELSNLQYKKECSNMTIVYGFHESPLGECLLAVTGEEKAVCFLWFLTHGRVVALKVLKREWPGAPLMEDESVTGQIIGKIFSDSDHEDLTVLLRGTELQIEMWKAFTKIPRGEMKGSWAICKELGDSHGNATITSAILNNRIGYLVPCHRVLTEFQDNSRWGFAWRKKVQDYEEAKNC